MAIPPPPLKTPLVRNIYDPKGKLVRQDYSPHWLTWFTRIHEEVERRIGTVPQKVLIHSWDEVVATVIQPLAAWPTANLAFFVPFTVYEQIVIKRILLAVGVVSSENVDIGIYDLSGARKVSTGSVSLGAGNNRVLAFDIVDTALNPGRYYMAMAVNSVVPTLPNSSGASQRNLASGIKEQTAAFPLPATAAPVDNITRDYIPVFVLSSEI